MDKKILALRDKKILTFPEYQLMLRTFGPCIVKKTVGSGTTPTYVQVTGNDGRKTSHYIVKDLISASYSTNVEGLPEDEFVGPPRLVIPATIYAMAGTTLDFTPEQEVTTYAFTKDGEVDSTFTSLKLTALATSMNGTYEVTATNDWGTTKATFTLVVFEKSAIACADSGMNTGQVSGNDVTYTGTIKYLTEADGLQTWPAGTYLTGNRVGVRVTPNKETVAKAIELGFGTVYYGDQQWSVAEAFATATPEEDPNFAWWPCVTSPTEEFQIIIDWTGQQDDASMEVFNIKMNNVTLAEAE